MLVEQQRVIRLAYGLCPATCRLRPVVRSGRTSAGTAALCANPTHTVCTLSLQLTSKMGGNIVTT